MTFEQRIGAAIDEMQKIKYNPQYLIKMIGQYGAVEAVKRLVVNSSISQGLLRLRKENALHLSLESIVLEPEWNTIFSDSERENAKRKLDFLKDGDNSGLLLGETG